jgi:hypothetical protein
MKLTDLILVVFTTMLLTANQVLLKLWMGKLLCADHSLSNFRVSVFFKPELIFCGLGRLSLRAESGHIVKRLDFSLLYPMITDAISWFASRQSGISRAGVDSKMAWCGCDIVGLVLISRS